MNKSAGLIVMLSFVILAGGEPDAKEIRKVIIEVDEAGDAWEGAYQLQSKHYVFRTDLPEADGRRIARHLDGLYAAFFKEFKDIIGESRITEKMIVYFYGDVKRFMSATKKVHPGMEESDGFLNTSDNIAHLFRIETKLKNAVVPDAESTFHECAHQIMSMALPGYNKCADRPHFWAVEGIACFFETLEITEGGYTLGKRTPSRFRLIPRFKQEIKKIKLQEYLLWNQKEILSSARNPQANYLLASILSNVLCSIEDGRYKKGFLTYAREVNSGKATKTSFEELVPIDLETLQNAVNKVLEEQREE